MNEQRLYRRLLRRETHRSRSVAVAIVMVIVALAAVYSAIECVLAALGNPPLLVSPSGARSWLAAGSPLLLGIAAAVVVVGIVLVIMAVTPGRRGRHAVPHDRMAVVVEDAVLAGAIARGVRHTTGVAPDRVHADVAARRARVSVIPTSGLPVDLAEAQATADATIASLSPRPRLRARVSISSGTVGS